MSSTKEKYLLFIGLCVAIIPILLIRDYTPSNELRYLSIADEALRNHTFFTFTNHGVVYADKPPLYLWIVMGLRWLLGSHQMWALALASVLPALVIVHVMDTWVRSEMGQSLRSTARMMLLTSAFFLGAAITMRMDMLMCMFIVLAMRSFWRIYTDSEHKEREKWLFAIYLFLALFTKGPLGILIPLLGIVVFLITERKPRRIAETWGWRTWLVLLVGCALWWGMVYAEGGKEYLDNLLFHQTVDRAVHAFHHKRPFYYYLICMWYCLAPWALLVIGSIVMSWRKKAKKSSMQSFFAITSATTLIMLSCLSGKLQIYMLPAIPFMVYAAILYLPEIEKKKWCKALLTIPMWVLTLTLPGAVVARWVAPEQALLHSPWLYIAATALSIGAAWGLYEAYKGKGVEQYEKATLRLTLGLFITLFVGGFAFDTINDQIGYAKLCEKIETLSQQSKIKEVAAWRVKNARDMDVYLHQDVREIADDGSPLDSIHTNCLLVVPTKDAGIFTTNKKKAFGKMTIVTFDQKQKMETPK